MSSDMPTTPPKARPKAVKAEAPDTSPKAPAPTVTVAPPAPQPVKVEAPPQAVIAEQPRIPPTLEPEIARGEPARPAPKVEPQVIGLAPRGPQPAGLQASGPRLVAANSGLVASHLGKQFKRRPVLRDVTVSVQRGEAVGLLGPNGAGKTTCFYIITGLINADTGTIEMDGVDITHLPMYRRSRMGIGYLPQEASIFRGLTVEENIRAVLEVVEPERDMREAMLDDLLAEFSISHLRRTPALALSGGERRRVEIARALASRPQFMLLDEPLAGIDPIAIGEIRELISHLRKRGIGVLITDHNVRETLDIVDRAYILHDGSVLMDGRPSEIVAHQDVRRVYLGERFSL
jgi:lipopolysaccharide export system ATP-binding protein